MKRLPLFVFLLISMTVIYGQDDEIYLEDKGPEKTLEYKETFMGPSLYKLELKEKYGIKHKDQIVIPVVYDELPMQYSDQMIVKKAGKYGIINKQNSVLFDFIHQSIKTTNNKDLNVIIEPIYNHIDWVYEDRYFCLTEEQESNLTVKLYDVESQKNLVEMSGFFRRPNQEGILKHHFKNDEGKRDIREINIKDLINDH